MNIFVSGATGYVGHEVALKLARNGDYVHVLTRNTSSPHLPMHGNIRVFKGDINDPSSIAPALQGCEQVYHIAAMVKLWTKDPSEFYKVNVEGTRNLLDEACKHGIKKFVFTSTCGVFDPSKGKPNTELDSPDTEPCNDYDLSKLSAEKLVKQYHSEKGLPALIVSLSKVFGPGIETRSISVNQAIRNYIKGKTTFIPYPPAILSNYCFINDIVEGHLLAMEKGIAGEKYILGGENISFRDFFQTLETVSGIRSRVIAVPEFMVSMVAVIQALLYKLGGPEPLFTPKGARQIFKNKAFSSDKAVHQLGYQITPLQSCFQQTIRFFDNNETAPPGISYQSAN